jgi:hypothetical protein
MNSHITKKQINTNPLTTKEEENNQDKIYNSKNEILANN